MPFGELIYDDHGRPYCHFCGTAWNSIGNHSWQKHDIRAKEYRELTGLSERHSLGSLDLSEFRSAQTAKRIATDPAFRAMTYENLKRSKGPGRGPKPARESQRRATAQGQRKRWSDPERRQPPRVRRTAVHVNECVACGVPFCGIYYYAQGPLDRLYVKVVDKQTCSPECLQTLRTAQITQRWEQTGDAMRALFADRKRSREEATAHGTRKRYNDYGCRCTLCRTANTEHHRRYRQQRGNAHLEAVGGDR